MAEALMVLRSSHAVWENPETGEPPRQELLKIIKGKVSCHHKF
jgi:hypothetical protein